MNDQLKDFARVLAAARITLRFDQIQEIADALDMKIPAVEAIFAQAEDLK